MYGYIYVCLVNLDLLVLKCIINIVIVFLRFILYDSESSYCILYSTIAILSSTLLMKSAQLKIP